MSTRYENFRNVNARRAARHLRRFSLTGFVLLGVLGAAACSWSRFDDVEDGAPVLLLEKPDKVRAGFGHSISAAKSSQGSWVVIAGSANESRGAAYALFGGQEAKENPVDMGFCDDSGNPCILASSIAGLGRVRAPAGAGAGDTFDLCFAVGVGETNTGLGVMVRCQDQTEYSLKVPEAAEEGLIREAFRSGDPIHLALAADQAEAPALLAGAAELSPRLAWFYPPLSPTPIELTPPAAPTAGYGRALASVRIEGGRLLAVGAPDSAGAVYLFRWLEAESAASFLGCARGGESFGRTLSSGFVNRDSADELVIADRDAVYVYDGAKLAELPVSTSAECDAGLLPPSALLAKLSCGNGEEALDCTSADFGAALAVGDLDGDGDGEVAVGAPGLSVRGSDGAGAVLLFDVEGDRPDVWIDRLYISSAESGDRMGQSLAIAPAGDQQVVIAGAPGMAKAAIFFCSAFSAGLGPRCE